MQSTSAPIEAREITEAQFQALLSRNLVSFGGSVDLPQVIVERLAIFASGQKGNWRYYELSNGGFYAAPDSTRLPGNMDHRLTAWVNAQSAEISVDAAGIATSLWTLRESVSELLSKLAQLYGPSHRALAIHNARNARLSHYHQCLQNYADQHVEADLIRSVADNPRVVNFSERTTFGPPDFTVSLNGREVGVIAGLNQELEFFDLESPEKLLDESEFTDDQRDEIAVAYERYSDEEDLDDDRPTPERSR